MKTHWVNKFLWFGFQVEGQEAVGKLRNKLAAKGPVVLYHGSLAAAAATAVGHFPWFYTFNSLQAYIPVPKNDETLKKFSRNALIGFLSSVGKNSCFWVIPKNFVKMCGFIDFPWFYTYNSTRQNDFRLYFWYQIFISRDQNQNLF